MYNVPRPKGTPSQAIERLRQMNRRDSDNQLLHARSPVTPGHSSSEGYVQTQARVVALQEQLTEAERDKLDISTRIHQLEMLLQEERALVRDLQTQLRKTEAENESLRMSLRDAKREAEDRSRLEISKLQMQVDMLQQELSESRAMTARARKQMEELESQLMEGRSQLRDAEEEAERGQIDLHELEQELQQSNLLHDKMTSEKNAEIARLLAAVESLNAELHVLKSLPMGGKPTMEPENMVMLLNRIDSLEAQLAAKGDTVRSRSATNGIKVKALSRREIDDKTRTMTTTVRSVRPVGDVTPYSSTPYAARAAPRPTTTTQEIAMPPGFRRELGPQDYSRRSPERPQSPMGRLEAALIGITAGSDDSRGHQSGSSGTVRIAKTPVSRTNSGGSLHRVKSVPSAENSRNPSESSQWGRSTSPRATDPDDPLCKTYPQNRHTTYEAALQRSTSPPNRWGDDMPRERALLTSDPATSTYQSGYRKPFATTDDLREELEAVKRETQRLRRDLH